MTHRFALRFAAMLVVAAAVGSVVTSWDTWELGLVVGWGAACLLYVSWVWLLIGRMDAASTAEHARREDPARGVSDLLILVASVASLGAVALLLAEARGESDARSGALAATALAGVALSWLLVHTLFTLRYAAQYYEGDNAFRAGDVTTVEPGLYVDPAFIATLPDTPRNRAMRSKLAPALATYAGMGIRIEDDYLITTSGSEWMSKGVPREIGEIESLMKSASPALPGGGTCRPKA